MKIKMRTLAAGPNGSYPIGVPVEVPDKEARDLIDGGYAVAAEPPVKASPPPPDPKGKGGKDEPKKPATPPADPKGKGGKDEPKKPATPPADPKGKGAKDDGKGDPPR